MDDKNPKTTASKRGFDKFDAYFFWPDILKNYTTSLSCSKWKLDECKNQNPPTNLGFHPAKCNPKFFSFVLFGFAFLA